MKPTDLADATARALDLLDPGDSANSDPRLSRDAGLVNETRLTRETAAEVWLAVSPLRVAPPQVWQAVLSEIQPAHSASPGKSRHLMWMAASGWAAAVVVAIALWPAPVATLPPSAGASVRESPARPAEPRTTATGSSRPRLREEVVRLQKRLATLRDDPAQRTPRVTGLASPGAVRRTPEEARQQVYSILTHALRSSLEVASGAPGDPAALVIERGWLPGQLSVPADGGVIRHRNFPEKTWRETGFFRSAEGDYYDASSNTVWSADPEGRGFIGRKTSGDDDLARFNREPEPETTPAKPVVMPEGFMIENPVANTTDIIIENVPVLPEGRQLIVRVTDDAGIVTEIPLTPTAPPPAEPASQLAVTDAGSAPFASIPDLPSTGLLSVGSDRLAGVTGFPTGGTILTNMSTAGTQYSDIVGYMNGGSVILSFPNGTIPAGFQLLEGSLVPTGQPPTVIVESGP